MTIIGSLMPNNISSMKPTKRKIVRTVYTTEKFTKNIQKEIPVQTRGIAQAISDACKNLRMRMTKN